MLSSESQLLLPFPLMPVWVTRLVIKSSQNPSVTEKIKYKGGDHLRPASQAHHLVTFGLNEIPYLKEISLRAIEEDTQWCKLVSPVCREMNTNKYVTGTESKQASKRS